MKNTTKTILLAAAIGYSTFVIAQAQAPIPAPVPAAPAQTYAPVDYSKEAQKLKKHIISFGFFSPINQHISFGYDQLVGTDIVFTSQLGIIGPGLNNNNTSSANLPMGAFGEAGVKLFFAPDFVTVGTLRYNSMQGAYFKPQVVFSSYSVNTPNYNAPTPNTYSTSYTGVAVMLNFGKQWILAHAVSLDIYAGVGYCISSTSNGPNYDVASNYYSFITAGNTLAFTAGLNLGVPF